MHKMCVGKYVNCLDNDVKVFFGIMAVLCPELREFYLKTAETFGKHAASGCADDDVGLRCCLLNQHQIESRA